MSERNSFRQRSSRSVLPQLSLPRVPPSASTKRDLHPRVSLYDQSLSTYYDFSDSDGTGFSTPDFRSEESDSSTGSVLERATTEATRTLADEWDKIERTLYDEEGPHVTRPQLIQECQQWKDTFPHLRVVGKKIPLPEQRIFYPSIPEEEVLAIHYSDNQEYSESDERYSESSFSDSTPQNSPRARTRIPTEPIYEPRLTREKSGFRPNTNNFNDSFYSLLQITPLYPKSPPVNVGKRHYSSIIKSDVSSSKWMRKDTPEPPETKQYCDRNSAKSFLSLDVRGRGEMALSASERKQVLNSTRVDTATSRDRLQPLNSGLNSNERGKKGNYLFTCGKVWLPPLQWQEDKNKPVTSSVKSNTKKHHRSAARRAITLISECEPFEML